MLSGWLVNRSSREEPVCLKYGGGLVIVNVGAHLSALKEELVKLSIVGMSPFV